MNEQTIITIVALGRLPALISLFIIAHWIDKLSSSRCYGIGIIWAGFGIIFAGMAGSTMSAVTGYILFYIGHGIVWGSNTVSVNACVEARLRDSAFAIMSVFMTMGVFMVGTFHHWLLGKGLLISSVFTICGIIAGIGGTILIVRSFKKNSLIGEC